ncbi:hypothetical protein ACVW00_001634 [Marmoricola sp. URHA0025 HA25]
MRKTFTALAVSAVAAAVVAGTAQPGAPAVAESSAIPSTMDPADFSHPVTNPWFPIEPGTTTLLRGTDEGRRFRERVRVTDRTRVVQGVTVRVVRDVLRRAGGSLAEATSDWYADDDNGNVWYFGERTATYDRHGHVESREGSWEAGVDGASAGLIMPADPKATDAYRQEYWPGHAEDQAWIVGFKASVKVPMRRFHHVLRTFEWSRLEPGVISTKLYARGVGVVRERDVAGGSERFEVVAVHHR